MVDMPPYPFVTRMCSHLFSQSSFSSLNSKASTEFEEFFIKRKVFKLFISCVRNLQCQEDTGNRDDLQIDIIYASAISQIP